jgi:site-specific DNA-methyltransferase (adenine-specific)
MIKPYYEENGITIYNADSFDVMRQMVTYSITLIATDPPYGINENNRKNMSRGKLAKPKDYGKFVWDKKPLDKKYFYEMFRVSLNQIIFGGNYYTAFLSNSSCWLVWDKDNGQTDFADCELAWTSFQTAVRKFRWRWSGFRQEDMSNKEPRFHPTQKPLPLMKWVLANYSQIEDTIFDPFMGAGTTLVAAKELGRQAIGCDLSKKYCDVTIERLRQESLFSAIETDNKSLQVSETRRDDSR